MKAKPNRTHNPRKEFTTDMQRLRFLVRLAQVDLDALRPSGWLGLQEELHDCLLPLHGSFDPGGLYLHPTDPPLPYEYSRADFAALQGDIREIVAMVLEHRPTSSLERRIPITIRIAAPHVPDPPESASGRHFLMAQGSVRDLVLLLLWTLLGKLDTTNLVRCPECDVMFFRRTNQEYCSRACINRVSQRRLRALRAQIKACSTTKDGTAVLKE